MTVPRSRDRLDPPAAAPSAIRVLDARTHNLKSLSVEVPLGKLVAVLGLSGSGKSSLAFDTLYAEGQRRYAESFSAYARQFLARLERPDAEVIGVPPAIAIDRKPVVSTSRSTVGTLAQILEPLRVLYATLGVLHCDGCGEPVRPDDPGSSAARLRALPAGTRIAVAFPLGLAGRSWDVARADLLSRGLVRALRAGEVVGLDAIGAEEAEAGLEVVVDRLKAGGPAARLRDSLEQAFAEGAGRAAAHVFAGEGRAREAIRFSHGLHCARCDRAYETPRPRTFSWNNPIGACPTCRGFGRTLEVDPALIVPDPRRSLAGGAVKPWSTPSTEMEREELAAVCRRARVRWTTPWSELDARERRLVLEGDGRGFGGVLGWFRWLETKTYKMHVRVLLSRFRTSLPCPACHGRRLRPDALRVRLGGLAIPDLTALPVAKARLHLEAVAAAATPGSRDAAVVTACRREIAGRLAALEETGLGYLELDRASKTLSGGELERVHLAASLGASLSETLFVLDEPSVGLHARDAARLAGLLRAIVLAGNTVVVVEHDPELVLAADQVLEIGPGAGAGGGELVFEGSPAQLLKSRVSRTGAFLSGRERIARTPATGESARGALVLEGAHARTLRGVSARFPLGAITVVCGVSGSGKSTLVEDVLAPAFRSIRAGGPPVECASLEGSERVRDLVLVDQGPVGRTPKASPLTYVKAFDEVRARFATTDAARRAGVPASFFSLNTPGGRCERCSGDGAERIDMQFLAPVFVRCEDCEGRRFRDDVLAITDRGRSIVDVLGLSVDEGLAFYADEPSLRSKLEPLAAVGLGYLRLGQPLSTLSGGEAQRLKLAFHLQQAFAVQGSEPGLPLAIVLDEPTAGLHLEDVRALVRALDGLARAGHAIVVVEHHLDVIAAADHVIELGPGGGPDGGQKVFEGAPAALREAATATGEALRAARQGAPAPAPLERLGLEASLLEASRDAILVRGAREHNLRGVSVDVPRRAITVVTGLSGSGKSTLAFDVLFREGQRRYLDTLSPYARQFVARGERPDVEAVVGVPPAVAIEQRTSSYGRLSTVATVVELHPFLRVLYANAGVAHCPDCRVPIRDETEDALARRLVKGFGGSRAAVLAPVVRSRKGHHRPVFDRFSRLGKSVFEVDGKLFDLADGVPDLERYAEHDVLVRVDTAGSLPRDAKGARVLVREALALGEGGFKVRADDGSSVWLSAARTCPSCARGFEPLDVRLFTWTARKGRCPVCEGLGVEAVPEPRGRGRVRGRGRSGAEATDEDAIDAHAPPCAACGGSRINEVARAVTLAGRSLPDLCALPVDDLVAALAGLGAEAGLDARGREVARPILRGVEKRLDFLRAVGLGYLSLDRAADTLSGGEAQRLRLAAQLGAGLTGVLYVLDEPTIGLHPRDSEKLIRALTALRDGGNTIVVVEHDERVVRAADRVLDLGPGAGREGGHLIAVGTPDEIAAHATSLTGRFLSGRDPGAAVLARHRPLDGPAVTLRGARARNLRGVDLRVPTGTLVSVSGVSGSGKSTLVREVFLPAVAAALAGEREARPEHDGIEGARAFDRVAEVDQSPIGRTPRSVPATYVKLWDDLRELFAATPEARVRGFQADRFSFNSKGGRCEECEGQGRVRVEMAFLPTVEVPCEGCSGARFEPATLEARFHGLSAAEVLALTVREAHEVFAAVPRLARTLELMEAVGLGYLQLGQPSTQVSGGEAQRLKLVRELAKASRGKTLYVLDEPTTGLHPADVVRLVAALQRLVDRGDTVLVIEHNLDVIAASDLVYDLGPDGGSGGGELVAVGPPAEIARRPGRSETAKLLREVLRRARGTASARRTTARKARR